MDGNMYELTLVLNIIPSFTMEKCQISDTFTIHSFDPNDVDIDHLVHVIVNGEVYESNCDVDFNELSTLGSLLCDNLTSGLFGISKHVPNNKFSQFIRNNYPIYDWEIVNYTITSA